MNKRTADQTRSHIQTVLLIKRLQGHALGELEMTATQIKAADAVLSYAMPKLKAMELDASGDMEVTVNLVSPFARAGDRPADN